MRFKACKVARENLPAADKDIAYDLRVIEFTVGKGKLVRLVTDLVDPDEYPAIDIAELYHQQIGKCLIDRPRRKRQCPRVVKRKMSNFKLKRKGDRAGPLDVEVRFKI